MTLERDVNCNEDEWSDLEAVLGLQWWISVTMVHCQG